MKKTNRETAIHCAHDKLVPLAELKPHPKNPNTHPKKQIDLLAEIIRRQGWRAPVVVSKRSGFVVAGHGRLLAAKSAGLKFAPVNYQNFPTDATEIEHLLADNKIAELSETSEGILRDLLKDTTLDPALTGYDQTALDALLAGDPAADLAAVIQGETEHHTEDALDPAAIVSTFTGHIERLAQMHPERLRNAQLIIIPAGRGHTRDCLILSDPSTSDAAAELRRLSEAGEKSPITGLFAALLPLKGTHENND